MLQNTTVPSEETKGATNYTLKREPEGPRFSGLGGATPYSSVVTIPFPRYLHPSREALMVTGLWLNREKQELFIHETSFSEPNHHLIQLAPPTSFAGGRTGVAFSSQQPTA